jgi:hypothetical protein
MKNQKLFGAICLITTCGLVGSVSAQITTYNGSDVGANQGDPIPNSDAAAVSFNTAASLLGPTSLINFESAPLGSFSSLAVAPGVTVTGTDTSIRNTPYGTPSSLYGYNTTPGGSQFLLLYGGSATFTFSSPIQAFGGFLTGVQLSGETINFSDGSSETLAIPNPGSGAEFFGFTDAGKDISSVEINAQIGPTGDIIGVDDVSYTGYASSAPDAASTAPLLGLAVGLLCRMARRKN